MKTNIVNKLLPTAVVALAVASAFAFNTQKDEKDLFAPEDGYIDGLMPCEIVVKCQTEGDQVCRHENGTQAFGKTSATECTKTLYRLDPQ